ncbi:phasin family protein [uncultured Sphingomonas sp.]|uniref:phasin family protein n=1 Tax=uncultured Sphingomonas sp. TaxID=158754 RepID=UPI0035CB22FF
MADANEKQGAEMGANAGAAAGAAADKMRDGAQKAQGVFAEQVVDPAKRAGEAMRAGGQKVAENTSQIGVKMIDQAQNNTQEAFDAMRRAAQAKDLSEVMRIQGDYLREQSTRSMGQAREIGELIMQFGRDAVSGMRGGTGGQN